MPFHAEVHLRNPYPKHIQSWEFRAELSFGRNHVYIGKKIARL